MSDRNDFDFDDDLFGDSDSSSSRRGSSSSGFDFGDDDDDLPPVSFGDDYSDMPMMEEEPDRGGASRTFVLLALLMILVFIGGLALVIVLITRPTGPTPDQLTTTYVVAFNATQQNFLEQTQTQARSFEVATLTAASFTDTPSPTATFTPTVASPTPSLPPTDDPTALAATQIQAAFAATATQASINATIQAGFNAADLTLTAGALTLQAGVVVPTLEPPPVGISDFDLTATQVAFNATVQAAVGTPDLTLTAMVPTRPPTVTPTTALGAVAQTATAIAQTFLDATAQAAGGSDIEGVTETTPTPEGAVVGPEVPQPTPGFLPLPTPSVLPDTGLFDDLAASGPGGLLGLSMMAFGLVGLIVVVRSWRARLARMERVKPTQTQVQQTTNE